MDRRSFMLGLAASTAAVPIAGVLPLADLVAQNLTATEILERYGRSPALDVARWWQEEAIRELHRVMAMPPEWLR